MSSLASATDGAEVDNGCIWDSGCACDALVAKSNPDSGSRACICGCDGVKDKGPCSELEGSAFGLDRWECGRLVWRGDRCCGPVVGVDTGIEVLDGTVYVSGIALGSSRDSVASSG